ncbi:MAG: GxxExxY protein [Gemmatimonadaceae bacterium]
MNVSRRDSRTPSFGAFFEVYNKLGFFESIYANALERELKVRGHRVSREVSGQIVYKDGVLGMQRIDMMIDGKVIVETKSAHDLPKGATRQVQSYLYATHLELALLLHFGPRPKFYRFSSRGSTKDPKFPLDPNSGCP